MGDQLHTGKGGGRNNGNQKEGGPNSGQNSYHTVKFFQGKVTNGYFQRKNCSYFYIISIKRTYVNCSLANFKRVARKFVQ